MIRTVVRRSMLTAVALCALAWSSPGFAAGWLEKNTWLSGPNYSGEVPPCDEPLALGRIRDTFAQKESRFWNSALEIVQFERVQETAFSPWASGTIPRRFCSAVALVSDGVRRPVHYSIAEDLGEIGALFGVEWCVVGIDRNWAYNPACRMAKP